jgi:hypothetical protein
MDPFINFIVVSAITVLTMTILVFLLFDGIIEIGGKNGN